MPSPWGTPRARAFGAELREHRTKKKTGLRELARELGISHGQLIRYEAGERVPKIEDLASILAALGVKDPERTRMFNLARDADKPNWLSRGAPGTREQLTALIEFERTASKIIEGSPLLIPGLLQTSDYARVIFCVGSARAEVEWRLRARMNRREVLLRPDPVELTAVIGEWALRERLGGSAVMRDQLRHLVDMAKRKNITIYVLPADVGCWTPLSTGPFMILEFRSAAPIVHLEHHRSTAYLFGDDVDAYVNMVPRLLHLALDPDESVALMSRLAEEIN